MRSVFGVFFFARTAGNTDYTSIARLSGHFATTYLFDDILDDPGYPDEEKTDYFQNVLQILASKKYDEQEYSNDPVMAFSERAFTDMRDILDERRGRMVAQSYHAIAQATYTGSHWKYTTPLTEADLYAIATIKAAYTRIIPAILAGHTIDSGFLAHCMRAGLIYQLTDDLRDITDDLEEETITPFNYYRYGISAMDVHPVEVFFAAVRRISEENLRNIPDARDLWVLRISHSLRMLQMKHGEENLQTLFRELHFPDDACTTEMARIGEYSSVIVDIEAEAAKTSSDSAVTMRGGWSSKPVYGH
ncbi:class 1 isoprenoid biosynthesis enzyme [Methanoculleus sp. FWC-SCC1]|uniref:Class 1 isoprenoid biosynthesis enzyme n=1 Tax=Methanoculleus frigidifontis TaxID=2584085 RepID=A0ABT8M743_9EURY|nr:class 1 isoprenoid biosynthesis enzyme [Methanoculleus sp. FWC-SCC1]MDN7023752.1 class 1 isoprenoid biosynthesis enzyme [Methanoculleus sp. FWC-SCC1]